jgi:hypothetical protein
MIIEKYRNLRSLDPQDKKDHKSSDGHKKKLHDHLDPEIDLVIPLLLVHAGRERARVEVEPVR